MMVNVYREICHTLSAWERKCKPKGEQNFGSLCDGIYWMSPKLSLNIIPETKNQM